MQNAECRMQKENARSGACIGAEEIAWYEGRVATIRGLIHYHERMVLPLRDCGEENCGKIICPAVRFENDIYLDALKEALRLMEQELSRLRG